MHHTWNIACKTHTISALFILSQLFRHMFVNFNERLVTVWFCYHTCNCFVVRKEMVAKIVQYIIGMEINSTVSLPLICSRLFQHQPLKLYNVINTLMVLMLTSTIMSIKMNESGISHTLYVKKMQNCSK